MMPSVVTALYFIIIAIFLLMGAAIVFHMLYYKINRLAARTMFIIYVAGAAFFLISNFILFRAVNWYQIASSF